MAPNIFLNIIGGYVIDRVKLQYSLIFLGIMHFTSQAIITIALWKLFKGWYYMLLTFRGVFGLIGESLYTIQATVIVLYCSTKNSDMFLGFAVTFPFIFNALNSILTTNLY